MKFCAHPWVGLDIDPQGNYRPCCKFSHSLGTTLEQYQNNPQLHHLRQQFLDGEQPDACRRCWQDEDAGLPSQRTMDHQWLNTQDLTEFRSLSLAFGNRCNLACRTCDSAASTGWLADSKVLAEVFPKSTYHHKAQFFKDITTIGTDLQRVVIHGGDPFLSGVQQQIEYLDFLINNGAEKIELTYITNGTRWPGPEFWERWPNFGRVNITLSIDGIGSRFEYIRYPAQWDQVFANICQYQQAADQQQIDISISHTVSILNVLDLPEFLLWCRRQRLPDPYLGMVSDPRAWSIQNLPPQAKQAVVHKLGAISLLQPVIQYLGTAAEPCDYIQLFSAIDQRRGQNFAETFPELAQLILG